ncbi:hypothetical protein Pcinc_039541 [Petrolisthes cinctipes]|uniref:Uncharacterized protein n=2 Tax=Petrolisthes cinctipes TaxID=88211 RepID=A0AAE1BS84_PETCI|nr:hypothetical protein Pcinc_039541 [Petrolisthes cinctipes]
MRQEDRGWQRVEQGYGEGRSEVVGIRLKVIEMSYVLEFEWGWRLRLKTNDPKTPTHSSVAVTSNSLQRL